MTTPNTGLCQETAIPCPACEDLLWVDPHQKLYCPKCGYPATPNTGQAPENFNYNARHQFAAQQRVQRRLAILEKQVRFLVGDTNYEAFLRRKEAMEQDAETLAVPDTGQAGKTLEEIYLKAWAYDGEEEVDAGEGCDEECAKRHLLALQAVAAATVREKDERIKVLEEALYLVLKHDIGPWGCPTTEQWFDIWAVARAALNPTQGAK